MGIKNDEANALSETLKASITSSNDEPQESSRQLRIVSIDGGEPKVLAEDFSGSNYLSTPDSKSIVFSRNTSGVNGSTNRRIEHYAVSVSSGEEKKLSGVRSLTEDSIDFSISSDSRHVVFDSDKNRAFRAELYSTNIESSLEDPLCIPIKSSNGRMAVVCL